MREFREFLIADPSRYECRACQTLICSEDPGEINKYYEGTHVHVIEYSALEQAEAKIRELQLQLADRTEKYHLFIESGLDQKCREVKELEAKLEIAVEALEFYADSDSWGHIEPGTHYATNIYQCVDKEDYGEGDFIISERMNIDDSGVGGKRARQALEKLRGE